MNIAQLFASTPAARHAEIVVAGDRVFFENEEFIAEGESRQLRLVRSDKALRQTVGQVAAKLGVDAPALG